MDIKPDKLKDIYFPMIAATMKHAPPSKDIDRLTELPEQVLIQILSLLTTKLAVQTSILSRRFRHLWKTSPVVDISVFDCLTCSDFVALANSTLLHRNLPYPIHHLNLDLDYCYGYDITLLTIPYISSLLMNACSLGLRHLTLCLGYSNLLPLLSNIFSFQCLLESLTVRFSYWYEPVPSSISLKHLKTLHIHAECIHGHLLDELVAKLDVLEDLHVILDREYAVPLHLKSATIRKLKLVLNSYDLRISAPSLELFEFKGEKVMSPLQWDWEMPMLRKAIVKLKWITEKEVGGIFKMLNTIGHVEELHIDITESQIQYCPFHALLVPDVDPPTFFNLKYFHLQVCFHYYNIEDLVTLLQHCPALETLKLIHKPPFRASEFKKKRLWSSMLPGNAKVNYRHAYLEDLHIPDKKEEFLRRLIQKLRTSKRPKT